MSALFPRRCRRLARRAVAGGALLAALGVRAAAPIPSPQVPLPPQPVVHNSDLDARLFYQVLIGEIELSAGDAGQAYAEILDAAQHTRDGALFERAVQIALKARAGNEALAAVHAWRVALPHSLEAMRDQLQIELALNKPAEAMEPLGALLLATPVIERPALIGSLPRLLARSAEPKQMAGLIDELLQPYRDAPETRTAARVATGRRWQAADDVPRASALLALAQRDDPGSATVASFAVDLMDKAPASESVVQAYLQQPKADAGVRLGYVRALTTAQRYNDAVTQLERMTQEQPQFAPSWLTLGALHLELHQPREAEAALLRYVEVAKASLASQGRPAPADADDDDEDDDTAPAQAAGTPEALTQRGLVQAWLMLSQAAEMRGDYAAAEGYLAKVDSPQRALEVQSRRAALLARQGKVADARALIRKLPERTPDEGRAKMIAEAQVLRDVKHWKDAEAVLAAANQRFPDDADLLYEQAMVDEKLDRLDLMEKLLRRVIELKPDHQHAYNALGYSLADRNQRLPEAKALIEKALTLAPGEPFITDSLGWVEFRLGHRAEALTLLRKAYGSRPDVEIAAHLGEVLWVDGQRDEARKVLREARRRDAANEVLSDVLARLKVDL